jgi:hypothetical protein
MKWSRRYLENLQVKPGRGNLYERFTAFRPQPRPTYSHLVKCPQVLGLCSQRRKRQHTRKRYLGGRSKSEPARIQRYLFSSGGSICYENIVLAATLLYAGWN